MTIRFIKPFREESAIQTPLGFLSLASKWGGVLFPGITVLTRDLHDVMALHKVACDNRVWALPKRKAEFRRKDTDVAIKRELARVLRKTLGRHWDRQKLLVQKMSYWQRYGTLLTHFHLLEKSRPSGNVESYRRLIFSGNHIGALTKWNPEDAGIRKRRLRHYAWYEKNRSRIFTPGLDERCDVRLARKNRLAWWWLTGHRAPAGVSIELQAVRRLEFFFVVWQTVLEAAILLAARNQPIPRVSPRRGQQAVAEFMRFLQNYVAPGAEGQGDDGEAEEGSSLRRIVSLGIRVQDDVIRPALKKWKAIVREIEDSTNTPGLSLLCNHENLFDYFDIPGSELLDELCELHQEYCRRQGKEYARYVERFSPRVKLGDRLFNNLSVKLSGRRWGLFGYRLEVSRVLHDSRKYELKEK